MKGGRVVTETGGGARIEGVETEEEREGKGGGKQGERKVGGS